MSDDVTLLLGDCLDLMPTLEAGSIDAIITDLPYGTTACSWDEVIPFAPMWEQVRRLLKPRGVFVTTASQPFTSKLVMSNTDWFRYEWIWHKTLGSRYLDANRRPLLYHENVIVFSRNGHTYNPQKWEGSPNHASKTTKANNSSLYHQVNQKTPNDISGKKYPRSVMVFEAIAPPKREHPTQKPVALYEYLIKTYTNPDELVLDIAAGSGTTGVAAVNTGRKVILIEKRQDYFEIMQRRISEAQAQLRLPV